VKILEVSAVSVHGKGQKHLKGEWNCICHISNTINDLLGIWNVEWLTEIQLCFCALTIVMRHSFVGQWRLLSHCELCTVHYESIFRRCLTDHADKVIYVNFFISLKAKGKLPHRPSGHLHRPYHDKWRYRPRPRPIGPVAVLPTRWERPDMRAEMWPRPITLGLSGWLIVDWVDKT
jgi:hypothetical protein